MDNLISQKTRIFTSPISTKQAKARCVERSVIIESIQIYPLKIKDSSVEIGILDLKITRIFTSPISTKQA